MFIDTNVILRYLLDDHQVHSQQARKLIINAKDNSLILTDIVLAEVYYVLCRRKQLNNRQVAGIFNDLMEMPMFGFDHETRLTRQIEIIAGTTLDFADCYLIARAVYAGEPLKTFDKPMQRAYNRYKK
jgi:predicted nucleic acid-binding protein